MSLQDQILTSEIKELRQKVFKSLVLFLPILTKIFPKNSDQLSLTPLQGNLIHQDNVELYQKMDQIQKENAELQKKVNNPTHYINQKIYYFIFS